MTRPQLIAAFVVALILGGVWMSSRDPSPPKPGPSAADALPAAAVAVSTAAPEPTTTPGPILVGTWVNPAAAPLDVLTLAPNVTTPVTLPPTVAPTVAVAVIPSTVAPTAIVAVIPPTIEPTPITAYQLPSSTPEPPTSNPQPPPPPPADPSIPAAEQNVIDQVNYQRSLAGLAPYARNEVLMNIARSRVADMAARGYFGHDDPVTGETVCRSQANQAGFSRAGENIFGSMLSLDALPAEAVGWFMTDAPHRSNLLHAIYTSIGAGIAANGQMWVLSLCFGG